MSWAELLIEKPADTGLGMSGSRFMVERKAKGKSLVVVDPAISGCAERDNGETVFVVFGGSMSMYITPDQATAMGMALIKGAAQERCRK